MFVIIEGIKNILTAKTTILVVAIILGLALFSIVIFLEINKQFDNESDSLTKLTDIESFLYDSITPEQKTKIEDNYQNNPAIKNYTYISKDSAAVIFQKETGEDLSSLFQDNNPLPASYKLELNNEYLTTEKFDSLKAVFESSPGVETVVFNREFILKILQYKNFIWTTLFVTASVVLITSFFLIIYLIRISINIRSEILEIMKLAGSRYSSIKGPFIIEGIFTGTLGSTICIFMLYFLKYYLNLNLGLNFDIPNIIIPILFLSSILLCTLATILAMRKFLKYS